MPEISKVRRVFSSIPNVYDTMNTLMSLGMDVFWRLELLKLVPSSGLVLDVGTGTGKLESLSPKRERFIGIDVTREMVMLNRNIGRNVLGSATLSPFRNNTFDAIVSAFVLRNLPSTEDYFRECNRLLKTDGFVASLDAFPERRRLVSKLFSLYFYRLVPKFAALITSSESYEYLVQSVKNFKAPETIASEMRLAGFRDIKIKKFRSPSAVIIYGRK